MNKQTRHSRKHLPQHEQGTLASYVIGFVLSLVFTFIPYYMVVHHTITGTGLLMTILGFAIAQMLVQILFFLHLGRGPKPKWNVYFFIGTVGIILIVVGGSIVIINNLHYNKMPTDQVRLLVDGEAIAQVGGKQTGACEGQHANHKVTIKDGYVTSVHTAAQKCDTLTFINEDSKSREITFGSYPNHTAYAGQTEYTIQKGGTQTITLSQTGTFAFYDHLQPETAGDFTVNQ